MYQSSRTSLTDITECTEESETGETVTMNAMGSLSKSVQGCAFLGRGDQSSSSSGVNVPYTAGIPAGTTSDTEEGDIGVGHARPPPNGCCGCNRCLSDLWWNFGSFGRHLLSRPLHLLLIVIPFAMASVYLGWSDEAVFTLNFFAILPLAAVLGFVTEELANNVGDTLGGLLNATFGNAVEMIFSVFALQHGLIDVVQGSLMGSVLSNLLLVLGCCFFFGGLKNHKQVFNASGARSQGSLLLLAVLAMIMPSVTAQARSESTKEADLAISHGAGVILLAVYILYLVFQLCTHPEYFETDNLEDTQDAIGSDMGTVFASIALAITTILIAICSEGLIGSVEGMCKSSGMTKAFIGVILLPIIGNAAEHVSAVSFAMKNKMDLALGVALGSSSQIALLVVPFTVIVGWMLNIPMDLNFGPTNTGVLLLTVLIVGSITSDGESNWLEGAMLLAAYIMIAVLYWFTEP